VGEPADHLGVRVVVHGDLVFERLAFHAPLYQGSRRMRPLSERRFSIQAFMTGL
jgi:hypothetical protein